jgi:hypothetical protein
MRAVTWGGGYFVPFGQFATSFSDLVSADELSYRALPSSSSPHLHINNPELNHPQSQYLQLSQSPPQFLRS